MPRKTMILKESTKRNKIKRLTKHFMKRNHKTAKHCHMRDSDAMEAFIKLGYKPEVDRDGKNIKFVSC